MQPLVPILAGYAMGLALLFARGGARDPVLAAALALPIGAAASAVLAFALIAVGLSPSPAAFGAAWGLLLAIAAAGARRHAARLWPGPALGAGVLALVSLAAARFDATVLIGFSHDTLLAARLTAAGGEVAGAPETSALGAALHTAAGLVGPDRAHAIAPVLALAGLAAVAVLLLRTLTDRRRDLIAAAAAFALATSFPLLRSLFTVGSPAVAGIMLLAAGGLWYACEVSGDRRPRLLALIPLAAFALQGGWFAAAALLAVAVALAAPIQPAARLAAAAGLAAVVPALGGELTAGLLAAAPLAVFSIAARVAGPKLAVVRRPSALLTPDDQAIAVVSWLAGAALVGALEWGLLMAQGRDLLAGPLQGVRLLPLGFGNLLPYALAAAALFVVADVARRASAPRVRRSTLIVAGAAGLLALPYAVWVARYAFSGPQAQAMAHRSLYVTAGAGALALGFAAAFAFAIARRAHRRFAAAFTVALAVGVAGALAVSRAVLANEYEPLHQLVAVWCVLFAVLAGREMAGMLLPRLAGRRRAVAAAAAAAALWAACAGVVLARDHGDAWLVWSETGASRYLTRRWTALTPEADASVAGDRMVVKPALESERTEALRAERAAAPAPDIVIFSVDGLRRDKVGAFGSRRGLTPNIDRMAARGVRFTRAVSSFPLTQVFNSDLLLGRYVDRVGPVQQPPGFRPLAITNLLKRRDYHLFVKSWFEMSNRNRFDPRPYQMDTYVRKAASAEDLEEPMESAMARIAAHLAEARERGRPVFLWMHLLTTHPMTGKGFVPHPDYDFGDSRMERYESAVAGTDRWLKGVEDLMATRSDRPVIWIICSDHGVNVTTYSRDLHEPVLRVPFVLVAPGVAPRDDDHLVDVSLDVAATVVDLAGVPPPPEYDGVSLVPLLAGLPADAMAERLIPLSYVGGWSGAVHGRFKYLRRADVMSLFDVVADPEEKHNLIGAEFERALAMRAVADRELERRFRDAAEARGDGP